MGSMVISNNTQSFNRIDLQLSKNLNAGSSGETMESFLAKNNITVANSLTIFNKEEAQSKIKAVLSGQMSQVDRLGYNPISSLNDYGKGDTLKTALGDLKVFLELDRELGSLDYIGQLINLDINGDGFLDSSDEFFDKLMVRGYNEEGKEFTLKFSDVLGTFDLRNLVKTQKDLSGEEVKLGVRSGTNLFRAEESYTKLNSTGINKLFRNHANKEGWVELSQFPLNINFAYKKATADGGNRLQAFLKGTDFTHDAFANQSREQLKVSFNQMYKTYNEFRDNQSSEAFIAQLQVKRNFERLSGQKFSEENLEKFYQGLNNDSTAEQYASFLKDTDEITAMKLNGNGSITLKFDSGRMLTVSELYSTNGEFNLTENGDRASVMTEAANLENEALNKLDFSKIGVDSGDKVVSLSDLGVSMIQKFFLSNGNAAFSLTLNDGSEMIVENLYEIQTVQNLLTLKDIGEDSPLKPNKLDVVA